MKKSMLIGLFLMAIMLSSTLIYFLSSLVSQPKLPEGNVVDYELNVEQKNLALRQGRVLMEFFYGKDCGNCQEKISLLDFLASQYKDKTFLEKILTNRSVPVLNIIGFNITENKVYLDERNLEGENITEKKVMDILCEVMIIPPVECAKI